MDKDISNGDKKGLFSILLDNIEKFICFVGMFAMIIIIFIHVIFRYVIVSPLTWSDEVARMCLIWITFGGSAYAFNVGANVGVTYFVDMLPKKVRLQSNIIIKLCVIAFFCFILYQGVMLTLGQIGHYSTAANLPYVIPYSAMPIGAILVIIRVFKQIFDEIRMSRRDG